MEVIRRATEGLARRTSRRDLFGRGAETAAGLLMGVAAGTLTRPGPVSAGGSTVCVFPGPPCPCEGCTDAGTCGKPCTFNLCCYASGCWVWPDALGNLVTCCDCDCNGFEGIGSCGCGSDYHNDPAFCA